MIKRINARHLCIGMYIHDVNTSWLNHPFLRNSFLLQDEKDIQKILNAGIQQVYIDTDQGLDDDHAPTESEIRELLDRKIKQQINEQPGAKYQVSVDEELGKAHSILKEANGIVHNILEDVRLGKQIETEQANGIVDTMTASILRNQDALIYLSRIKSADEYTYLHSISVSVLMIAFARHQGLDAATIKHIGVGALLHDIGKMLVPSEILNKPAKLSDDEFAIMKSHVERGVDVLKQESDISTVAIDVVAQHHERVDGSGYPAGLSREQMSPYGRMASIVDVYDALSSDRVYHKALEPTDVLRKIMEWSQHHFDEKLAMSFVRCIGIYPVGSLVRLQSGLLGIVTQRNPDNALQPKIRIMYNIIKKHYVPPYDLDLADAVRSGKDKIIGHESPTQLGINVQPFI